MAQYMYLTGFQIKNLAVMAADEDECSICIREFEESVDDEDGEKMPAGLYAYYDEYPDEGRIYLPPEPEQPNAELRREL